MIEAASLTQDLLPTGIRVDEISLVNIRMGTVRKAVEVARSCIIKRRFI